MPADKDFSIERLVARLAPRARGWLVVDHWPADRRAVGIASGANPARLVYVSTFGKAPGACDYERELPVGSPSRPYEPAGGGSCATFEELLAVLAAHLDGA